MILIKNGICQLDGKYATQNQNICQFRDRYGGQFLREIQSLEIYIEIVVTDFFRICR